MCICGWMARPTCLAFAFCSCPPHYRPLCSTFARVSLHICLCVCLGLSYRPCLCDVPPFAYEFLVCSCLFFLSIVSSASFCHAYLCCFICLRWSMVQVCFLAKRRACLNMFLCSRRYTAASRPAGAMSIIAGAPRIASLCSTVCVVGG